MANCLIRLTVHEPEIIAALDVLRAERKQCAFVVAALRHFLRTDEGKAQLAAFLNTQATQREPSKPKAPEPCNSEPRPIARTSKTNLDDIFG